MSGHITNGIKKNIYIYIVIHNVFLCGSPEH